MFLKITKEKSTFIKRIIPLIIFFIFVIKSKNEKKRTYLHNELFLRLKLKKIKKKKVYYLDLPIFPNKKI
jgi:hypothetical protein